MGQQVLRKPVMPAGFAKETHEQTHPIEMPVKVNQIHQSSSNGLQDGRRASARKYYKRLKALPSDVYQVLRLSPGRVFLVLRRARLEVLREPQVSTHRLCWLLKHARQ